MARHAVIALLVTSVICLIAVAARPAAASAAQCAGADRPAMRMSNGKAARLTLCLLNKKRAQHHMRKLRPQKNQRKAASRHNRLMIRKRCFSHECSGEPDLVKRLTRTGYLPCGCAWMVGENIAWGSRSKGSPRNIVDSWMASPAHRENILNPRFEHIGIAVDVGSPQGGYGRHAATYTTDFGAKSG